MTQRQANALPVRAVAAMLALGGACSPALADPTPGQTPANPLVYIHVPVAVNSLAAAAVVFIASIGYLGWRQRRWDDLARAAALVTLLNTSVLLLTGSLWAKAAWGHWWVWSPRLTFSLVLWLLYAVYLVVRSRQADPERRASVCAIYGVVAFLDVPLVYLSVKLLPDVHPGTSALSAASGVPAWVSMAVVTACSLGLTALAYFRDHQGPAGGSKARAANA